MECEVLSENPFFIYYSKNSGTIKSTTEGLYSDDVLHYPPPLSENCFVGTIMSHKISTMSEDDLSALGLSRVSDEANSIVVFYYVREF